MDYTNLQSVLIANIQAQIIARRDYKQAQAEVEKWERRYQLALVAGREHLIQEAQFRQKIFAKKACNLKTLLDEQTERVATLRRSLTAQGKVWANSFTTSISLNLLEEKLWQIEERFQATVELPGNNLKIRLHKVESEFESMKLQLLEQQTNISNLLQQNLNVLEEVRTLLATTSFESTIELTSKNQIERLVTLQPGIDIDAELASLKQALASFSATSQNPTTLPTADTLQIFDAELEELRSQLDNL